MSNIDDNELKEKKIKLEESENEEEYEEDDEIEDTFSQKNENNLEENESSDSNSENNNSEENNISEELLIKDEIENVDFKSLLKAKAKLSYENSKQNKNLKDKKKLNKNIIKSNLEKINKNKKKLEPKEFSALIRPKYDKENKNNFQKNSTLLHKKFSRDPRFDDISGILNEDKFKKNFGFVNEMAEDYINKLKKVKKSKKYKNKLSEQQYELIKKQNNYVKSWMNQQKQKSERDEIKKEINKENKERISKGLKPIYINQNKLNKYFKNKDKNKDK